MYNSYWKHEDMLSLQTTNFFIALETPYSCVILYGCPDSKIHGANMGPTWVLVAPGGPHVGHTTLAIWVGI